MLFRAGLISTSLAVCGLSIASAVARQPLAATPQRPAFQMPAPTPNDTLKSVEVQPDHHVRFRNGRLQATGLKLRSSTPAHHFGWGRPRAQQISDRLYRAC